MFRKTSEPIEFSLSEMLTDFTSVVAFKAAEKGVQFIFKAETLVPALICTDPFRLRQILTNIVGNALKFTDKGSVELNVSYQDPVLKFTVKDTGVGISKDQESKLFQAFTQADISITRKFGGTGLGLVLSRRLAEALGGSLVLAESTEGSGSVFNVEIDSKLLPNAKLVDVDGLRNVESPIAQSPKDQQVLKGLHVLLVEDSPDNQWLITTYLNKAGAQVTSSSDGAQGVQLALADNFDVLLMDIQMPILDGHEATKRLRKSKYIKPIIALTAHALNEERNKCAESGFTDFLTKPIQRDLLIEVLARYVP